MAFKVLIQRRKNKAANTPWAINKILDDSEFIAPKKTQIEALQEPKVVEFEGSKVQEDQAPQEMLKQEAKGPRNLSMQSPEVQEAPKLEKEFQELWGKPKSRFINQGEPNTSKSQEDPAQINEIPSSDEVIFIFKKHLAKFLAKNANFDST